MRWSIELYALGLRFTPGTTIKAQVLMDFLAEHSILYSSTIPDVEPGSLELNIYTMKVDRVVDSEWKWGW